VTARSRTLLVRAAVGAAVIAGVLWYVYSRGHAATTDRPPASAGSGGPAASAEAGRPVPVQMAPAKKQDLPVWIEGLGTVAAFQQVTVHTQVDGPLQKVVFVEGQTVKQGDVLAQIDPRPFLVQLHQAQGALARDRAQRDNFQRTYDRDKSLHDQNLIAQATVDNDAGQLGQAEGAMKIDQAQIEAAQLNLDYATVKAPLDGITGVRQVDAGNIVHATDPNGLVVITAIDPAAVFFTIPQDRLPQIAAAIARGDVPVEVWNRDGAQLLGKGKLAVLDNQINQTTATLRLKALVDNPQRTLWPNAFVKARALVETRKGALVIPSTAVQQGPQGTFVYIAGPDGSAVMKPVVVAFSVGEQAVIDKGLDGSEQVVVEGQNQLRPGAKLAPVNANKGRGSAAGPTASNTPAPP
jgi:multidrug efflux system membrane fusion protein